MSKAWDLSCTCPMYGPNCPYCKRIGQEKTMSADWLHDDDNERLKDDDHAGYHLATFDRGTYGESSKILEEVRELQDAEEQGARIMALHELSDILGAVYGYLRKHYPDMKFEDLIKMANITRRAFENGKRK